MRKGYDMEENRFSLEGMALWLACKDINKSNPNLQYTTAEIYDMYIAFAKQQMLANLEKSGRQDN